MPERPQITPCLLLDETRMLANIERMTSHLQRLGVALRPHVKTCKNIDIARRLIAGQPGGITVSTLAEADYFFEHGITDILYAVGIAPAKLPAVAERMARGMQLRIILDHEQTARSIARASEELGTRFRVLVEIDADGERAGLRPDAPELLDIAGVLQQAGCHVDGVMVHAGGSYHCTDAQAMQRMAETERSSAVVAAERLRQAGFEAPIVSVGSTPTATFAEHLEGATEVRAGVHVFQDLVQAGLGVCGIDDIAISVLTEVIGHREAHGQVLVDAGWMALSRDRGTAEQPVDQGYGLVCDATGRAMNNVIVVGTNQEHGIVGRRDGSPLEPGDFPVGKRLRILPNHACATAAQHDGYWVVSESAPTGRWLPRCRGW
jgi:D-serine deaminase-like pyridoxal phosphate-dependent protein